nr:MCE family protein [Geodermatophilaceae bacterium]
MSQAEPEAAEPIVEEKRRTRWPSPIWLVPLVVVVVALGLMFQSLTTRGPEISVIFTTASGLSAGETPVRYRDVEVGRVQSVTFTDDLEHVRAVIRMDRSVAPYLDESAKFWVIRPQVSAQGITGIETVISGSYIQASWDTVPGEPLEEFTALESSPQTPAGTPGIRLTLRAEDGGSLEIGSPIFFKRVEVGRVESKRLTDDGTAVEFEVFVNAPNDQLITNQTRFWNASGVDIQLGADGAQLRIASLSSLVRGGASFDQVGTGTGAQAEEGAVFRLFPSESDARENVAIGDIADRM